MPEIVLHNLDRYRHLPLAAVQRVGAMRVAQPVSARFLQLQRVCALQADGGLGDERLDRLVKPRGRPGGRAPRLDFFSDASGERSRHRSVSTAL